MNSFDFWGIILLPFLIFFARIIDVSIGTIRIILVSKGHKYLAPVLGFFEVLIWITAMGKIMQNLDRWYYYLFYAAGFATGNLVGMILEEKIALGFVGIRIITRKPAHDLILKMRESGYGITSVPAEGATGLVHVLFATVKRKNMNQLLVLIKEFNPKAFYTIEEIKAVSDSSRPGLGQDRTRRLLRIRKGK